MFHSLTTPHRKKQDSSQNNCKGGGVKLLQHMEMLIVGNWIKSSLVEVGRIILLSKGPYSGQLATIVEIIDHKRVWPPYPYISEKF